MSANYYFTEVYSQRRKFLAMLRVHLSRSMGARGCRELFGCGFVTHGNKLHKNNELSSIRRNNIRNNIHSRDIGKSLAGYDHSRNRSAKLQYRQRWSAAIVAPYLPPVVVDARGAADRLADAIRFQTISFQTPSETTPRELLLLHAYLHLAFGHDEENGGEEGVKAIGSASTCFRNRVLHGRFRYLRCISAGCF